MKQTFTIIALLVIVAGIGWFVLQNPDVPETSDELEQELPGSHAAGTQPAEAMPDAVTTTYRDAETSVAITYTDELATFTGFGYADVLLSAVPSESGARYESTNPALTVTLTSEEVTIEQDGEVIFTGESE